MASEGEEMGSYDLYIARCSKQVVLLGYKQMVTPMQSADAWKGATGAPLGHRKYLGRIRRETLYPPALR